MCIPQSLNIGRPHHDAQEQLCQERNVWHRMHLAYAGKAVCFYMVTVTFVVVRPSHTQA